MRIGRLEIGKWSIPNSMPIIWFEYWPGKDSCGCTIVTICNLYATWLGYECYGVILERRGKSLKRLANIRRIRKELSSGRAKTA